MARIENWNPPKLNVTKATYTWDTEYAELVHNGDSDYPARPWVDNAVANIDFVTDFKVHYQRNGEDLDSSFLHIVDILSTQCIHEMQEATYYWPRETKRKSGEIVGSPRDIVDTGRLMESQSVELEITP